MMPQSGKDFGQAAKATAITVNCIAGKTTICGKPYLVSGILIGRYDNGCVGENQEVCSGYVDSFVLFVGGTPNAKRGVWEPLMYAESAAGS